MPKVQHVATLHPDAVTNQHAVAKAVRRTRRSPSPTPKVTTSKKVVKRDVDKRVWREAKRLAGGDESRIEPRSRTEVVVTNRSKRLREKLWEESA